MRPSALLAITAATLAVAGCASSPASTRTGPTPNPEASASFSSAAAARSSAADALASSMAAAANAPCTTKACIAQDAEQSLPGAVARDNSVITKATCYKRTVVHHAAAKTWTVQCKAYYTDGTSVSGYANLLLDQNKITWQPTG